MIDQIRTYITIIAFTALAVAFGLSQWELHNVKQEYDEYKESIDDQVQKNEIKKHIVEAEQDAKFKLAETGYSAALGVLNDRLRDIPTVPRCSPVPVAGSGGGAMPEASVYTEGTQVRLETFAGTCDRDFYEAALIDALQCSRLIEFVR